MAELSKGGRSVTARASSPSTRPAALAIGTSSSGSRCTRASTSASASSIPGRSPTADHDNPAEMAGETIAGRYRLLEPLGRGAMSAVWLAQDRELEREVAVETLAASADRARVQREAIAGAAGPPPHIRSP